MRTAVNAVILLNLQKMVAEVSGETTQTHRLEKSVRSAVKAVKLHKLTA